MAEERINDMRGEKWNRFMERLRASIDFDRRITTPETLGYNGDRSESYAMRDRLLRRGYYEITYSSSP